MENRLDKIKKIIENNKNSEVKPTDIFNKNTNWVDEEISTKRYDICKVCPEFIKLTTQCKQCGCVMKIKSKLELASCPIGKW
jgi:hypothetical protein